MSCKVNRFDQPESQTEYEACGESTVGEFVSQRSGAIDMCAKHLRMARADAGQPSEEV